MAYYQLFCLIIFAALDTKSCYGQSSVQDNTLRNPQETTKGQESTLPFEEMARIRESTLSDLQEDVTRVHETTLPSLVKEVEDNSRYKTLEANATLLRLLVNNKDGVSRSEVFDMLHSRDDNEEHVDLPVFPEDSEDARVEVPIIPDSQAEFLQASDASVSKDSSSAMYDSGGEPVGAAAGIMVVITCSIVCLGYTGLIVWRRIYLKRNGLKHELLRNEENVAETRIEL